MANAGGGAVAATHWLGDDPSSELFLLTFHILTWAMGRPLSAMLPTAPSLEDGGCTHVPGECLEGRQAQLSE